MKKSKVVNIKGTPHAFGVFPKNAGMFVSCAAHRVGRVAQIGDAADIVVSDSDAPIYINNLNGSFVIGGTVEPLARLSSDLLCWSVSNKHRLTDQSLRSLAVAERKLSELLNNFLDKA